MSDAYRQPAGHAPPAPVLPREVLFRGHPYEVHPYARGRWSCPACGRRRWLTIVVSAKHRDGEWVDGDKKARGALLRECDECGHTWFVEGLAT